MIEFYFIELLGFLGGCLVLFFLSLVLVGGFCCCFKKEFTGVFLCFLFRGSVWMVGDGVVFYGDDEERGDRFDRVF